MQITETNATGLKREFKVVIPADTLKDQVDTRLKELGERIRMPGFRPGKVPLALLKQRYEKSVMGEVLEKSVQEGSSQLMTERNLRPAGQPKVEIVKFETGQDLEFSVAMEVIPEITPVDFKTLSLQKTVVDVPESEIEESLDRLAKRQRKAEPAAEGHAAQSGDVVVIDCVGDDENGDAMIEEVIQATFSEEAGGTKLELQADAAGLSARAVAALGGMPEGWAQTIDRLSFCVTRN